MDESRGLRKAFPVTFRLRVARTDNAGFCMTSSGTFESRAARVLALTGSDVIFLATDDGGSWRSKRSSADMTPGRCAAE